MAGSGSVRPVVTLWETYGSGAHGIGPAVATVLGIPFVGQAYSSEELESVEEEEGREEGLLARLLGTLGRTAASADVGVFSGPAVADDIADSFRALRAQVVNGGVVLGRNGTVILADLPHVLHVKLDGPLDARLARGAAAAGIDRARAAARQAREDRVRAEMSIRRFNWDPRANDRFDLVVNTVALTQAEAVDVILAAVAIKSARAR